MARTKRIGLFLAFLGIPHLALSAVDLKPWFAEDLLPQGEVFYNYQAFNRIDSSQGNDSLYGYVHRLGFDGSLAILDTYALQAELLASASHVRSFNFEAGSLTGRLHLSNDILGDALSSIVSVTIRAPLASALRDYSLLYHGLCEWEAALSFGREISCMDHWLSRFWGVVWMGIATQGAPWVGGKIAWERQLCEVHQFELFLEGYGGLGHHALSLNTFQGYGSIRYRGADVGLGYRFLSYCLGTYFFNYSYRPYAYNMPSHLHDVRVGLEFDF